MESYKEFEIKQNQDEYIYDYNFGTNNLHNASIQQKNEEKFDILLNAMLSNNNNFIS